MTGVILAGMTVGMMVIPPIANWLISTYSWRTSYAIIGIMVLVVIISAAQFLRRDPSKMGLLPYGWEDIKAQRLNLQASDFSLQQAIRSMQLWILMAVNFCGGFVFLTIWVYIVPHAIDLGITAANATTILVVIGGAGITGQIIMGGIADKIGNKKVLIIGFILMSLALFWLSLANDLWMLYLSGAVLGLGSNVVSLLTSPMIAELFGLHSHGVIFAVIGLGYTFAGIISPVLIGYIFDITNSYQSAWLICGTLTIVAVIVALLLKLPRRQEATNDQGRSPRLR